MASYMRVHDTKIELVNQRVIAINVVELVTGYPVCLLPLVITSDNRKYVRLKTEQVLSFIRFRYLNR